MGPGDLQQILRGLILPPSDRLIVGTNTADDAGVYLLDDETALVLTVDFFTPIADDPYIFGAIAAVNSLSDVYAMGGKPLAALNICCFPTKGDKNVQRLILQGGADKVGEAGAVIAGGHSVRDNDLKYGMAVIGKVHPEKITTNAGARPGDKLLLTKPIGTGLLSTARRKNAITESEFEPAIQNMLCLNREAAEVMVDAGVRGATDITGFGLIGHAWGMAEASDTALVIDYKSVPLLPGAMKCASQGHIPGGTINNRNHYGCHVEGGSTEIWDGILYDPQTAGGLLISSPPAGADQILASLPGRAWIIGEVITAPKPKIILRS